ncbi:MAG: CarD family transcriptional regulator [Anaerolineales bacterium]|jgi:RNA polymerase-interacting CarD/CdnL/TRCF family regulator
MAEFTPMYSIGDTVVHRFYGIGHIDGIENKPLNGVQVECFRVNTPNSVFWFPTDSIDNPRIHLVASHELIQEAIEIIKSVPNDFDDDPILLNERIDDVWVNGDILAVSKLIRDLTVLKAKNKLGRSQDQVLNNLIDYLLREWAASSKVDINSIRPKLSAYLASSKNNFQSVK